MALGRFPTGVAIVTALNADGLAVGLTVSSFNTVSLEPPLIVWSLQLTSRHLETFDTTTTYAVNVLSSDQVDVSNLLLRRWIVRLMLSHGHQVCKVYLC